MMIDLLKKFFGSGSESKSKVTAEGEVHDIRVAACALLLEMAGIDGEFTDSERDHLLAILKGEYGLSEETAEDLAAASKKELDDSVDLWQFASAINQRYSSEEKVRLLELIWKIVYADGQLNEHEDYLVHKLSKLLRLSHAQLIEAKLKVSGESPAPHCSPE